MNEVYPWVINCPPHVITMVIRTMNIILWSANIKTLKYVVNILIQSCLTTWLFKLWLECLESLNYSQCFAIDGKRTNGNQLCGEVTGGAIFGECQPWESSTTDFCPPSYWIFKWCGIKWVAFNEWVYHGMTVCQMCFSTQEMATYESALSKMIKTKRMHVENVIKQRGDWNLRKYTLYFLICDIAHLQYKVIEPLVSVELVCNGLQSESRRRSWWSKKANQPAR